MFRREVKRSIPCGIPRDEMFEGASFGRKLGQRAIADRCVQIGLFHRRSADKSRSRATDQAKHAGRRARVAFSLPSPEAKNTVAAMNSTDPKPAGNETPKKDAVLLVDDEK